MYYLGDLNPVKHFRFPSPAVGFAVPPQFRPPFFHPRQRGGRLHLGRRRQVEKRYSFTRNLRFRSLLVEGSVQGEINFFQFEPATAKRTIFTPFIFGAWARFTLILQLRPPPAAAICSPCIPKARAPFGRKPYFPIQASFPFTGAHKNGTLGKGHVDAGMGHARYHHRLPGRREHPLCRPRHCVRGGKEAVILADQSIGVTVDNTGPQRGFAKNRDWYSYLWVVLLTLPHQDKDPTCSKVSRCKSLKRTKDRF